MEAEKQRTCFVLTISDRCFDGEAEDTSGPAVVRTITEAGFEVVGTDLVPDNRERIIDLLIEACGSGCDLVLTTGGTGLAPRDLTPQATAAILDYEVPGLPELMRRAGAMVTPTAALSRAVAGVRGRTLVINLPGSERGATESLAAVLPVLDHAMRLMHSEPVH
jgi:molybdenum cofactor synthesis domain-containing protein